MEDNKKQLKLKNKFLGNTGVLVSELCLGTMTLQLDSTKPLFGGMPCANLEESIQILDRFVAAGGNFIDTADRYAESEKVVGTWLAKKTVPRHDLVIATKVRGQIDGGINRQGLSRKHIVNQIQNSLTDLQTDYVDLYQCHFPDTVTPMEDTFRTFDDLVRSGKIRYIGISNFTGWQLQKAVDICKYMGLEKIVSVQQQYSLLSRYTEWDVATICENEGISILPWSPLKGGWLSGKYKRGMEKPNEGRVSWAQNSGWDETNWDSMNNEVTWNTLDVLESIAKDLGRSQSQVALRWLMQKPVVTAPIIGARKLEHLEDNLRASEFVLTDEQMAKLDKVSTVAVPYPWRMRWNNKRPPV